jgi:hypothetical protein
LNQQTKQTHTYRLSVLTCPLTFQHTYQQSRCCCSSRVSFLTCRCDLPCQSGILTCLQGLSDCVTKLLILAAFPVLLYFHKLASTIYNIEIPPAVAKVHHTDHSRAVVTVIVGAKQSQEQHKIRGGHNESTNISQRTNLETWCPDLQTCCPGLPADTPSNKHSAAALLKLNS